MYRSQLIIHSNQLYAEARYFLNRVHNSRPEMIQWQECADYALKDLKRNWRDNINSEGHWNTPHTHPNSDFALVLYLTDSDGLLTFLNPHAQRNISKQNTSINAKKGDIVIFPSDLVHYVMPNPREEDRISISMNLQLC